MTKIVNIESENTPKSVEETTKQESGKIVETIDIIGTPFKAVKLDNGEKKANFVAWGANRLSGFKTDEEITETAHHLEKGLVDWEVVGAMAACIAINIINESKEK